MKRRSAIGLMALLPCIGFAPLAQAQAYPAKTIRWVVPYPAGGGSDFLARTIAQQLSGQVGQPVVVDNKAGGNTAIAASEVARSGADGYTILSADNGTMVFNTALYSKLSYNPEKDLTPVTLMGKFPMVLVVGPGSDAKDAKDFIAKAKANPGKVNYGSAGAGSPHHLAMELLKVSAGLHMVHIPYRGSAPAFTDLIGGQVQFMAESIPQAAQYHKQGKVRALAVTSKQRNVALPDVPTVIESGIKGFEVVGFYGFLAPAGTPKEAVARLSEAFRQVLELPDVRNRMVSQGADPAFLGHEDFARFLASEMPRWAEAVKQSGAKQD